MTEKVYATQRPSNLGDRKIENPVRFLAPEAGVKTVYVQDGFPRVVEAYTDAGVTVKSLEDLPKLKATSDESANPKKDK